MVELPIILGSDTTNGPTEPLTHLTRRVLSFYYDVSRRLGQGARSRSDCLAGIFAAQPFRAAGLATALRLNDKEKKKSKLDGVTPRGVRHFFADLGPGLITGAADDDPSGISTYSVTGASFGYAPLWTAVFSFPLMTAVQMMCARLGMVTGRGLGSNLRRNYPRGILWAACASLIIANVVNIGADLGGMAEATGMMTGISQFIWTPIYAVLIISLLFWTSYRHIAKVFKWLTLILFAYIIAAFLAHPDWGAVLRSTFVPHVQWSSNYLAAFVGILGTTISPYLFFWQA